MKNLIKNFIDIVYKNIFTFLLLLYSLFGFIAGIIGTLFSIIIRVELAYPGVQVLGGDWQFYNVVVTAYAFMKKYINMVKLLNQVILLIFISSNIDLLKRKGPRYVKEATLWADVMDELSVINILDKTKGKKLNLNINIKWK